MTLSNKCGVMMTPLSAIPAATSAICKVVAVTFSCPIADFMRPGVSPTKSCGDGKFDAAASPAGRSMGGTLSNPNAEASRYSFSGPRLWPTNAKAVSHDLRRTSAREPPQYSPPKLDNFWPLVSGRVT